MTGFRNYVFSFKNIRERSYGEKDLSFSFFMLTDLEIRIVNNGRKSDE